jgi:periplasmic divalent cation tolerance protein
LLVIQLTGSIEKVCTGVDNLMDFQYILVMVTAPTQEVGEQIIEMLIEKKLAACVNMISPVNSCYLWQGKSYDEEEVLLIVKTRAELFEAEIVPAIKGIHPYDVPEIIALPILMGSQSYLDWIGEMTER